MKRKNEQVWKDSKFYPTNPDPDIDPGKAAFSNMVKESIQHFPDAIQMSLLRFFQGGNGFFDNYYTMMAFEEAALDWMYEEPLEAYEKRVNDVAKFFNDLHAVCVECEATMKKWFDLSFTCTYEDYVKAINKIRLPKITFNSANIEMPKEAFFKVGVDDLEITLDGNVVSAPLTYVSTGFAQSINIVLWNKLIERTEDGEFGLFTDDVSFKIKKSKVVPMTEQEFDRLTM